MKLAVFSGQYFWFDGRHYSTDEAFVKFVNTFCSHFGRVVYCDSVAGERETQAYVLDPLAIEVCPLPYFSVHSFWKNLVIFPKVYAVIRDNIDDWGILWLHAPHPVSLIFAYLCRKRNKPFFLFVRQNLKAYVRHRSGGPKKMIGVAVASVLECIFRRISAHTLTFAVGSEVYEAYRKGGGPVYETAVSLVSERDISCTFRKHSAAKPDQIRLLNVGRLDPEKGVIYLINAVHELVASGEVGLKLRLVGKGSEEEWLQEAVNNYGLSDHVDFCGYVSHNGRLMDLYRDSHIFILPSLTEGCPQTLFEAMACGVPVIASRVGGIPSIVKNGENGLLVNSASSEEICEAVRTLISNPDLGRQLAMNGLDTARSHTMEAEREKIMSHIEDYLLEVKRKDERPTS